jgi:nucleotide-binding universal stress UspA family protein
MSRGLKMYRRILVPTDGSACSEKAAQHAVALARTTGSSVVFLFVMDTVRNYHEGVMNNVKKALSEEGDRSLGSAQRIAADAGVAAEIELVEGDPADVILGRAENFDLVVMGSHGKGLWKQLTVGSVTQAVLRRITRPLLLVPCADALSTEE